MKSIFFVVSKLIKSKNQKFFSLTTNIALGGIALSVTILILTLQILDGFENTIYKFTSDIDSEIKITAFDNNNLPDDNSVIENIKNTLGKNLFSVDKFIAKYAIGKGGLNSDGVLLVGIKNGKTLRNLKKFVKIGNADIYSGAIIGLRLAENLNLTVGDKITFFALRNGSLPSFENPPNIEQIKVVGIFETGMPYYDTDFAFIFFDDAQKLFSIRNSISGYNIFLNTDNENIIESLTVKLRDRFHYPYFVRSIFSIHKNIFVWLDLQKKPIPVVLSAIVLVAMLNIIGVMFLLVLKRRKTIGILRTLGFSLKTVRLIFVLQGAFIAFAGITIGILLALLITFLQNEFQLISLPGDIYFLGKLIISTKAVYYFIVAGSSFLIGIVISFLPASVGSKISPVNAIRNI